MGRCRTPVPPLGHAEAPPYVGGGVLHSEFRAFWREDGGRAFLREGGCRDVTLRRQLEGATA
eukprot:4766959-Lingulodinium_polyedra.AAC.1